MTVPLRRLTDAELALLHQSLKRYGRLTDPGRLLDHLDYLSEEALRSAGQLPGRLPRGAPYENPETARQAFLLEKGADDMWAPVVAALRETTTPLQFANYMRTAMYRYFVSVGRRQQEPRLYQRTARLLKQYEEERYRCLERNRKRRLAWWGRWGWPEDHARHSRQGRALLTAGRQALDGLPRVRDRKDGQYAPRILSNPSLNDLVTRTMDRLNEGLTLDQYGWLFKRLFPIEYRRIDEERYEGRKERLGDAGEIALAAAVDENVDVDILSAIQDEGTARRLQAFGTEGRDVDAAADELGESAELIVGALALVERYMRQRGFDMDDFDRVIDRLSGA